MINNLYADFAEKYMSMPVIKGVKSKMKLLQELKKPIALKL